MKLRSIMPWTLVLALGPASLWAGSDYLRVMGEFRLFEAGVMPDEWKRARVPVEELDQRFGDQESWKSFRNRAREGDAFQQFVSANRPFYGCPLLFGYSLRRERTLVGYLLVEDDGRTIRAARLVQ